MSRLFDRPKRTSRRRGKEQASAALENVRRRFGRTTSARKSEGGAYGKAVGLGISTLVALIIISLSVWLLRKRAGEEEEEESTPVTPEQEGGVEAVHSEEVIPPGPPSAEDVPPREEPLRE